jgi:hypothetical protein
LGAREKVVGHPVVLGITKLSTHELAAWPALREVELAYAVKTLLKTVAAAPVGIGFVVKVLGT